MKRKPADLTTSQAVPLLPPDYPAFLRDIKARIRTAQVKATLAANAELIRLYWNIGRDIVAKQERDGWGTKVIDQLAKDLNREFAGLAGFSRTNLYRMRAFYVAWSDEGAFVPQPVGQMTSLHPARVLTELPWGHNVILLEKLGTPAERLWYARAALEHGWSRDILALHIQTGLHQRQGKAVTNFNRTLPPPQSDLAAQTLKDPYIFGFLTIAEDAHERDVENQLCQHITRFLIELGAGFAFVGQQVHLEVGGDDFYLDLLFYHTRLHCYVVIDLKNRAFRVEDAGKMNFYLSAVDAEMRQPEDKPSLGLLLCRSRNQLVAEYALRDVHKPIGVAEWTTQLTRALPTELQSSLPTVEQIEAELEELVRGDTAAKGTKKKSKVTAAKRSRQTAGKSKRTRKTK